MSEEISGRYTPDDLGQYVVYNRDGVKQVSLGASVVRELGVEHGDEVVAEQHEQGILVRPAEPKTGAESEQ